jgi:hypothetical protein
MNVGSQKSNVLSQSLKTFILAGSLMRIFVCFQHHPLDYLFSDPLRHWSNGQTFLHPDLMGIFDPIGYQIYLFFIQKLTGGNRLLIACSCGLLSAVMPWLFYRAAREFGVCRKYALFAWAAIVWMPSLVTIYHYFMMETLLLPLMGLGLWMSGRYLRKRTLASFLVAITVWMLASLTKTIAIPLACVCVAYCWWKSGWKLSYLSAGALIAIALILPNAIRTYRELGYSAPLGNAWITKILHRSGAKIIKVDWDGKSHWEFSSPVCYVQPLAPLSSWMIHRANDNSTVSIHINSLFGERDWINAYRDTKLNGKNWWLQLGENILLFCFSPSWPDGNRDEWDGWLSHHSRWIWCPLAGLILVWNCRDFRERRFAMLPLAVTALTCFLLFQNLVTMEGRYRKPVEPFLILNLFYLMSMKKQMAANETRKAESQL